jgi:thiol:disulfide interchange protein
MLSHTLFAFCLFATSSSAPQRQPYDPARDPQKDVWAAMDVARAQHKRILLEVGGEWCGWCHLLDKALAEEGAIREQIASNFVVVKVNVSPENWNAAFLSCFPGIPGYPHFFVLDSEGRFLHSQGTDELSSSTAYYKDRLLLFLQRWSIKPGPPASPRSIREPVRTRGATGV